MNNSIFNLARQLSEVIDGEIWLDETFLKKLTGITAEQAFTRPMPSVHSVAEIVSHLLEWRISVFSILLGGARTLTMDSPSNWKSNDILRQEGWSTLKEKFYKSQRDLIEFLSRQEDDYLLQVDSKENHTYLYYVEGLIHHDMYHLGQIGLVIKMLSA